MSFDKTMEGMKAKLSDMKSRLLVPGMTELLRRSPRHSFGDLDTDSSLSDMEAGMQVKLV